jgi:hypothetical protein
MNEFYKFTDEETQNYQEQNWRNLSVSTNVTALSRPTLTNKVSYANHSTEFLY